MRYLAVAIAAVVIFVAGYLAANLRTPDADAQGTWQVEYIRPDGPDPSTMEPKIKAFVSSLPTDCDVDVESHGVPIIVAYRCPD